MRETVCSIWSVRDLARFVAVILLVGIGTSGTGRADDTDLPAEGSVESVANLLQHVQEEFPGRVLTVELEQETLSQDRRMVYEVKVLTARGEVLKVYYDAYTLAVQRVAGRKDSDLGRSRDRRDGREAETGDGGDSDGDDGGD